jgi:cytochrome oxidase assembly protein ShyY1
LPKPVRLEAALRNQHLQYALTWFGLAIALATVFAAWARGRLRQS